MLKQKEEADRGRDVQKRVDLQGIFGNAFYPLTLPLTVGPGSISIAITLGANLPRHLHLCLLWFRRPPGGRGGRNRHEHRPASVLVSSGLHWRPNHVEWRQRAGAHTACRRSVINYRGEP